MAYASALRESSTMFAVVIGVVFLKEQLDLRRLAAGFCAMAGSMILKINVSGELGNSVSGLGGRRRSRMPSAIRWISLTQVDALRGL
jgi:drug/metabolite transporter (DMT)-like permease